MFIVFDLDDTLADTSHRQYILEQEFETSTEKWNAFFDACDSDVPVSEMITLLDTLATSGHRVEIWTGRSDRVIAKTKEWLSKHLKHPELCTLRMRQAGDFRSDIDIKGQWLKEYGTPDLVFDDRNRMVQWWRAQGIICCQVKESNF